MIAKNDEQWHKLVTQKFNYICQGCLEDYSADCFFDERDPEKNQYVCGHHVKTKGSHPELRLVVENGVCVCFDCHEKVHRGKDLSELRPKEVLDFFL